ncbi:MAG TPA: TM0106 family RecB-like putative nuclease [Longimicrobiales bacterium]|nr:TM0106 family RecB-like putative nuclease [Longimicrobiales bacterium]
MRAHASRLYFSATDLSSYLGCPHLTLLDRAVQRGELGRPRKYEDPGLEVLKKRGEEHERSYLERLRAGGKRVAVVDEPPEHLAHDAWWERYAAASLAAMRAGADVVYQAALYDGTWVGKADFLVRVDTPSELGAWSYEVVDTKLAREAKGGALLQVLLYAELLAKAQGRPPERVHLALGGPEPREESFRVADYAAYFRSIRDRFLAHVGDGGPAGFVVAPDPVAQCDLCSWRERCAGERRDVDHLSLVAGIGRRQRGALLEGGVATMAALADLALPPDPPVEGVSAVALERVREQARLQVRGRREGRPVHELLVPIEAGQGLAALPAPSPGDLFFDLEGDPYALTHGLEYLFGFVDAAGEYTGWWALDRASEKAVFERFVDLVIERLDRWPALHVHHFGIYEDTALKKLMGRHATREAEVDRLLRGGVLVDLHRVVKGGLRASVESYSIKKLEPHYGYAREVELRAASSALGHFEAWLELGRGDDDPSSADALLAAIHGYNRDDCVSTLRLRDWLEGLRDEAGRLTGEPVPRPAPEDGDMDEAFAKRREEVGARMDALLAGVPADPAARTAEEHARWLLAQLLEFHRRENKATWWEYYRCLDLGEDEMVEDRSTLGGLVYEGVVGTVRRSEIHRYRFPTQEHGVRSGGARDPATGKSAGDVWEVDAAAGAIDLKRGRGSAVPHPRSLIPYDMIPDRDLRESLLRLADSVLAHGFGPASPHPAALDLLLARPPRVGQPEGAGPEGAGLKGSEETTLDAARRLALRLDRTVLPIQGPPGAGKTYTGARMIVRALAEGKRVGITATSHKVISNLLAEVCAAARKEGVAVEGIQKADEGQWCGAGEIAAAGKAEAVRDALSSGAARLAAGTAWLWAREDMAGSVDLLFVDEAGQYSLANALAVAPAGGSLVLLGDPRQLEQPQQGVHPEGADVSALDHLLRGEATVPPERGLFLAHTYRLHPDICAFTSEIFYQGRLESRPGLESQAVRTAGGAPGSAGGAPGSVGGAAGVLNGSGLRLVPVSHAGNQSESVEEADVVASLVARALDGGVWTDDQGAGKALGLDDILVVAPYNAQVKTIAERLPAGARVGTVDRFQGQQAPIVIYSMATSTPDDAPRGMLFLYSPNRLNVATSRAKCLAVVVASPALFAPECRTPEQMRLANAFCRFRELAAEIPA